MGVELSNALLNLTANRPTKGHAAAGRICVRRLCAPARPYDILTPLLYYLFLVYIEEHFIKNG